MSAAVTFFIRSMLRKFARIIAVVKLPEGDLERDAEVRAEGTRHVRVDLVHDALELALGDRLLLDLLDFIEQGLFDLLERVRIARQRLDHHEVVVPLARAAVHPRLLGGELLLLVDRLVEARGAAAGEDALEHVERLRVGIRIDRLVEADHELRIRRVLDDDAALSALLGLARLETRRRRAAQESNRSISRRASSPARPSRRRRRCRLRYSAHSTCRGISGAPSGRSSGDRSSSRRRATCRGSP